MRECFRFKHRDCVGYRQILSEEDEKQPNGKVFQKYVMGGYKWLSYSEIEEAADNFGRALATLVAKNSQKRNLNNKNIVIFSGWPFCINKETNVFQELCEFLIPD